LRNQFQFGFSFFVFYFFAGCIGFGACIGRHVGGEQSDLPFSEYFFPSYQRNLGVEKYVEFFDSDFEKSGEKEMAELVDYDEDRKADNQLSRFDEYCFHRFIFP